LPPRPAAASEAEASVQYEVEDSRKGKSRRSKEAQKQQVEPAEKPVKAAKEQVAGSISTTAPAAGTLVKLGRREGWARFLAYEVRLPVYSHQAGPISHPYSPIFL